MSKQRYFYTDPLAAAWMAKHFGMEFTDLITGRIEPSDVGTSLFRRGYVHPDSLHLLEPHAGDLIRFDGGEFGVASNVSADEVETQPYKQSGLVDEGGISIIVSYEMSEVKSIIQRNGVAFICPESETA